MTILTRSYLEELAENAGFESLSMCVPTEETSNPEWIAVDRLGIAEEDNLECPHTLIMEGVKPAQPQPAQ